MMTLDEGIGLFTLAKKVRVDPAVAPGITLKDTPTVERVDPKELESCYIFDAVTFNSINKATQAIMSADYHLVAKDPIVLNYFTKFLNDIGKVGEDITFREMLYSIFQYQMIYGNAFVEIVWNAAMTKVVDLVILDPKRIDYAKLSNGQIALDIYGKPIGYVQKVPSGVDTKGLGDPVPNKDIQLGGDQIFIKPQRICHFKLFTYGDRFYGIGLIEPAYLSIKNKMNIEKAHAEKASIPNPVIDYIGDEFHEPTPDMVDNSLTKMRDFKANRYFAFPFWHKLSTLDLQETTAYTESLKYLRENQAAALGIPLAFALGSGEATNRSTLASQQEFMEFTLNDIVEKTVGTIRKYIFSKISATEQFSEVPTLYFENIAAKSIGAKSERLVSYVKAGILAPTEVHEYAIKTEGLDKADNAVENEPDKSGEEYANDKEVNIYG